jgi:glycosyltransferase involved in cell wall biosynthesis
MRILVITNYYPPVELGGWEQLTCNVVTKLQEHDHQVAVLTSNYQKDQILNFEPHTHRSLHLESYDPEKYHPNYTLFHRKQERENIETLTWLVNSFDPDIIYINGMWNLPYSLVKAAEELSPGRVVYYIASYWPTEIDAHTAYWTSPAESSWRQVPKSILASLVKKAFISSTPRNQLEFKLVLCVSAFVQDYLVEEVGVPKERTRVVHNGIELELFKVDPVRTEIENLRLLYAGRLSPDKGVHTILESLGILKTTQPDLVIELSIYGSGSQNYQKQLEQLVSKYHLESCVRFEGVVPREEMPDVYAAHYVLIFPSIWAEPLARIIQEAMACGLVVIGTATGGTREILHDGENGLIFEAGDAQMLAEKIFQIFDDEKLRTRLAKAGRRTVKEEFSLDCMVEEIEKSFTQILEQRKYSIE